MFRRLPFGAIPGYGPICVDSNDSQTVEDAYAARLLRDVPVAVPAVIARFKLFVEKYVTRFERVNLGNVSFASWIASRINYNQERKDQLTEAFLSLQGGHPTKRQLHHVDSFIKSECYGVYKHGRMINSRCDVFKAWAGPYISACEEIVYRDCPEFIKHTPIPERPALIAALRKAGLSYWVTDFTAFESHFVPEIQNACENALFRHLLRGWSGLGRLIAANSGPNRMGTRIGVKATTSGRRMSGDMWTSLGNGFTNLMLAKFIAEDQGCDINGYVEGDDGVFATKADLSPERYRPLGFTIKSSKVADPCVPLSSSGEVNGFCGMIFPESGQLIKEPRRVFQSFGWTLSFIDGKDNVMNDLLRAKALSLCYEIPHCPVLRALADRALKVTSGSVPRWVDDGYHRPPDVARLEEFDPTPDTRDLFAYLFDINPCDQISLERAILDGDVSMVQEFFPPVADMQDYVTKYIEVT